MNFIKRYAHFISDNYKHFAFFCFFYAAYFVFKHVEKINLQLYSFPDKMIGIATLSGIDIHKRMFLFYQSIFIFVIISAIISCVCYFFSERRKKSWRDDLQVINCTSIAGLFFLFFKIIGQNTDSLILFTYSIQLIWLVFALLKNYFFKSIFSISNQIFCFSGLICISISGAFFLIETNAVFRFFSKINFLPAFFFSGIILSLLFSIFFKNKDEKIIFQQLEMLSPIALIPLFSVLKDEFYLILNNKQIYFFTPHKIYFLLLFFLILILLFRYYFLFRKNNFSNIHPKEIISKKYFPFTVISLAAFVFYQPFIQQSTEMFELANRSLPIAELFRFGTVPVLQKFNSHMFSEISFGMLYTFINGLHGQSFLIYDFIFFSILPLIIYFFILYFTENAFVAAFFALFFPLTAQLLPGHFVFCLFAFFAFRKLIEQQKFRNYIALIGIIIFLLFWQIDLGYPALWATTILALLYFFSDEKQSFEKKIFLKSIFVFFGFFLLIILMCLFQKIKIFENLRQILNYFNSAQSYGNIDLGNASLFSYKMQYFVFPFLCLLFLFFLIVHFKKFIAKKNKSTIACAIVFLAVIYFVNFQRGLVRHSFAEEKDYMLSSFIFFIFSGSIYLFFENKSAIFKFIAFTGTSVLIVFSFNFPSISADNLQSPFSAVIQKSDSLVEIKPISKIIDRCVMTNDFQKNIFSDFKKFIDKNLLKKQTFIDFSNSPMLYFYAKKENPCFFSQNTLSLQNEYLQTSFLKNLKNYDVPMVVYSYFPKSWWDNVDDVPNSVRHYKVAEYIFQNYQPYIIVQQHCLWKKNTETAWKNSVDTLLLWSAQNNFKSDSVPKKYFLNLPFKSSSAKKYVFKINYKINNSADSCLYYSDNIKDEKLKKIKFSFFDLTNLTRFFILDSAMSGNLFLRLTDTTNILSINVFSSLQIPDFYSQRAQEFNLMQLPFIAAQQELAGNNENEIASLLTTSKKINKKEFAICELPKNIDRTSGNYIFITLHSENNCSLNLRLSYGINNTESGSFLFAVPSEKALNKSFSIRVSTQYNWYSAKNNWIKIASLANDSSTVELEKITLLKGNE